jgi:mono/diheme cytochrome c family protein
MLRPAVGPPSPASTRPESRSISLPLGCLGATLTAVLLAATLPAKEAAADPLAAGFAAAQRFLARSCLDCHSGDAAEGDVDLAGLVDLVAFRAQLKLVQRVEEMVASGQMPPPDAEQPTEAERQALATWLKAFLAAEARAQAGDPGRVVLRRLNNAEYTYTIRNLTGVTSLDPVREFPADGGAGEGFTNTGQSLVMSPSLVTKYLDAAKEVAAHAVLLPDGIRFSAGNSRRDFTAEALARLKAFYARFTRPLEREARAAQTTVKDGITMDMGADGFLPVELYVRATLDLKAREPVEAAAVDAVAGDLGLSRKYLALVWQTLSAADSGSPVLDPIRALWRASSPNDAATVAKEIGRWQDAVWKFNAVGRIARPFGLPIGPADWQEPVSPLVTEKEFRVKIPPAPKERESTTVTVHLAAGNAGDGSTDDVVVFRSPRLVAVGKPDLPLRTIVESAGRFGRGPDGTVADGIGPDDLCFRAGHAVTIEIPRELADGCELVTTATLPAAAGPEASIQAWVGLGPAPSAGFSAGAAIVAAKASPAWERFARGIEEFRDLFPKAVCYARIVPVDEVVTVHLFYREDDQLRRLLLDDVDAAALDRLWDELLFVAQEPVEMVGVFEQYQEYVGQVRPHDVVAFAPAQPVITARAEAFKKRLVETEPRHVAAVVEFAARAFRRPLEPAEEARLRTLYATLRGKDLPHEEAIRTLLTHVLVAPEFLYKLETPGPGSDPKPISDYELATRLSYFLWSSLPDAELLAAAERGRLHDPDVLKSEVRRMLAAPAARRLAEQFGTQWLHVYGFSSLDEKNAELFPTFADLRADMEEETVLFLDDFFRNDRSILSLVDADHTFLNERLAKHYGIEGVKGEEWRRVDGVRKHGRGSILCLATTLSTQAGASRTSPILRGNWLYETILGEKLPKPPKDVPQLAETVPAGLSERQLIAMHSENAACARCHRRIDPFGFALEEFDAIGRLRTADASGRPIDARATALDGTVIEGQQGLRAYLLGPRREQFVRVFCRKLLGYALGRGVQLSDEPLLEEMAARLAASDFRISVAIEAIVTSPQFLSLRGRDAADDDT